MKTIRIMMLISMIAMFIGATASACFVMYELLNDMDITLSLLSMITFYCCLFLNMFLITINR